MNAKLVIALGLAAVLGETALWHGPLGAGERFAAKLERSVRLELDRLEMLQVKAALARKPLRRILVLGGLADEFQHEELSRRLAQQPGVSSVVWVDPPVDVNGMQ